MGYTRIETIGESFNKFVAISKIDREVADAGLKTDEEKQEYLKKLDLPVLNKFEGDLYVLWSLLQQMKLKATEQGLDIITESTATTEDIRDLGTALAEGQNINAKLAELKDSMHIVK